VVEISPVRVFLATCNVGTTARPGPASDRVREGIVCWLLASSLEEVKVEGLGARAQERGGNAAIALSLTGCVFQPLLEGGNKKIQSGRKRGVLGGLREDGENVQKTRPDGEGSRNPSR